MEVALDKLLSSFHSGVFAPADAIYSSSLCTASSRTAKESIALMLALEAPVKATNNNIAEFKHFVRDGAVFLSGGADLPDCCLDSSEHLDVVENQLDTLEAEVAAFTCASDENDAGFSAINAAYVSLQHIRAQQSSTSSMC
ncbi:hypothetical protein ABB37_05808 [Leptomonas pyrrhocoris]|uniref:Uncharacterized protein n=1 Tax=Leptomonas pyrrhocoris TaxID=157538 RepID=A0A0N0DUS8_LEPPY|nr:hypothetical protein ABB37_05808 [Leptomonas pyrrhocoris]KPA79368.1 hypothetical protein ABB37_05808 [Leptomonas pyrrhocoris]|eukprot:XP_015657807.1 hypothetical protein ABB37_05808 [Leptomonas pyrrhocoris]